MDKRIFSILAAALGLVVLGASVSHADLWVPGSYQTENGGAVDWDPPTAPMMTDLTGGFYELELTGLTGTNPARHNFKILDDEGSPPPAWGDPEVPNNGGGAPDNWFKTDAAGNATIMVDRNLYNDGFFPATDRVTISTDNDPTLFTAYYATGNWELDAGGAGPNFSGGDPLFEMSNVSGDLWEVDVVIPTPGTYAFKATALDGVVVPINFQYQWGANGRSNNGSNLSFFTVAADQEVTFMLDLAKGAIGFSTETFLAGDTDNDGMVEFEDDFGPIRDNWLNSTFLRAEGNLDNLGASEGVVDIADFRQWKNACALIGCTSGAGMAAAFASLGGAVPEPSSLALALFAGMGLVASTRKRLRRTNLTSRVGG